MNEDQFFDLLFQRIARPWLTGALIAVCAIVFALELRHAHVWWTVPSDVLLAMGADFGPKVQAGEYSRLLSTLFLHGSPLHLALNMLALWQVGQFVERLYGRFGMLLLFIGSGLLGSLASIWWRAQGLSVGASGAIFGLYGALLVWLLRRRGDVPLGILKPLRSGTLAFIGYSLFAGFALPGIDNAAHIGGLLGGALLGAGLAAPLGESPARQWRRPFAWIAVSITAICGGVLWHTAPQVAQVWQQHVELAELTRELVAQDTQSEQQLQRLLEQVRTRRVPPKEAARMIEKDLLPAWSQTIDRLASEQIAPADQVRHQALLQYASLRYQSQQMLARWLQTGQPRWRDLAIQRQREAQAALLGANPPSAR